MYNKRQLMSVRLWLSMLCPFMLTALLPITAQAQCNYNEGASPTFNIAGNNTSAGYSTVVIAADEAGNIQYLSSTSSKQLQNLAAGKYDIYSFNYQGTAPASLAVGGSLSALLTESSCAALSSPIRIGVCKCTDELPSSGTLNLNLTATGQNTLTGYTQQYLLLGPDGKIKTISSTPSFSLSEVNNYSIYGINYNNNGGLSGLAVGNTLSTLSGDCYDLSAPLDLNVCPLGALPVTLISFKAAAVENTAQLTWSTSAETNSDHFEIQRSVDGKKWKAIGSVQSEGESSVRQTYFFTDQLPVAGISNLYRLKMIDLDNTFAYSSIREVRFQHLATSDIYPNPAEDVLNLKVTNWKLVKNIRINDLAGAQVYSSDLIQSGSIDISKLNAGIYILRITHTDGSVHTQKFVRIK